MLCFLILAGCGSSVSNAEASMPLPAAAEPVAEVVRWRAAGAAEGESIDSDPDLFETFGVSDRLTTTGDEFELVSGSVRRSGRMSWSGKTVTFTTTHQNGTPIGQVPKPSDIYAAKEHAFWSKPFKATGVKGKEIQCSLNAVDIRFISEKSMKRSVNRAEASRLGLWVYAKGGTPTEDREAKGYKSAILQLWPDNRFGLSYPVLTAGTWSEKNGVVTLKQKDPDPDFPLPKAKMTADGNIELTYSLLNQVIVLKRAPAGK